MTAPDLAELRRLLEASSPGEWSIDPTAHDWEASIRDADQQPIIDTRTREDAELIVAMRNAIAPLLDRIDAVCALHYRGAYSVEWIIGRGVVRSHVCAGCGKSWPCETVKALGDSSQSPLP